MKWLSGKIPNNTEKICYKKKGNKFVKHIELTQRIKKGGT